MAGTPTPTLTSLQPTTPASLTSWAFYDPYDISRPDLITKSGVTFRLRSDWEIDRIEYVYKWWGLGEPIFNYHLVEHTGG
ncbi:MAG TPA: hypothetical protein VHV83_15460, partial [Armatimonadota bacterium]|nr:hypothetical protein [Armatimonadota bacterium]